ncbi:hypothetical protein B5X24_HaOG209823 [Helicoverpa armigera]|nr:hypothetical protein B5X24_HaOG209823 [Helicoverpa armigera]
MKHFTYIAKQKTYQIPKAHLRRQRTEKCMGGARTGLREPRHPAPAPPASRASPPAAPASPDVPPAHSNHS